MRNIYHQEIMSMLTGSGVDGMNVKQLSRMLYNLHTGFFAQDIVYDKIYAQVRRYLWGQSRQRRSPIVWLRRGQYGLRQDIAVQLDFLVELVRDEDEEKRAKEAPKPDYSRQLELF